MVAQLSHRLEDATIRARCSAKIKGAARLLGATLLAIANASAALGPMTLNQHGLTGSWYDPANGGEGVELEVYPNAVAPGVGLLQGGWFTFPPPWDYSALQLWYTFSGVVSEGATSATLTLYQNLGGNFNALPVTSATPVGTVVLSFSDCATGTMDYAFTDGGVGSIPLTRLTPDVTCSPDGTHAPNADFGYSGHWFDPAIAGQGVFFELNPVAEVVFFAWYTYAQDARVWGVAGQRWYTGLGHYTPGSRSLPMSMYETGVRWHQGVGGMGSYRPYSAQVGTATATFIDCETATFTFSILYGLNHGAAGSINLSRLGPTPSDCR